MAIIYRAELRPTKAEILQSWLPEQRWFTAGQDAPLHVLGAYRFDDPDGEVGMETHVVRVHDNGPVVQVPLTYRGAPLPDGEPWLVATTEHSVLGSRWVYDACGDPVYANTLAATIAEGGTEAAEMVESEDGPTPRDATVRTFGSGSPVRPSTPAAQVGDLACTTDGDVTTCRTGGVALAVRRVLHENVVDESADGSLMGSWGQDAPVLLATLHRHRP